VLVVFCSLILYGLLGLYDDIKKFFGYHKEKFWGLRIRYKLILQILIAVLLGWLVYQHLGAGGSVSVYIPFFGDISLSAPIYTAFAALTIVATANAFNITDGLDGLASGMLVMTLLVLLTISLAVGGQGVFHATSYPAGLTSVIGLWLGSILAFLYFNIYPARVWMGDSGALAFGASLAVLALLLGIPILFIIIGGLYVVEAVSSIIQMASRKYWGRKVFLIAPIHHHFEAKGWPETKVTMRFWLIGAVFSLIGLFIYLLLRYGL
jgi:phospho-N-acetylmuramoyl-pentapeptide-transferase